ADFVESILIGLMRGANAEAADINENGDVPEGFVPCFGGRSISPTGELLSPAYAVPRRTLSEDMMLGSGDVLIRSIFMANSERKSHPATLVTDDRLPATFDRSCLRIRFRSEVPPHVAELLLGYLKSPHAKDWLIANGVQTTLNAGILSRLEVPDPSREVLGAI